MRTSGRRHRAPPFFIAVALVAACVACGEARTVALFEDPEKVGYAQRLELLAELGKEHPGFVEPIGVLKEYGMWAGIYLQTAWQDRTGRGAIPHWKRLNYALSVEPVTYLRALERAPKGSTPAQVCADSAYVKAGRPPAAGEVEVTRAMACEAWLAFFVGAIQKAPPAQVEQALWRSHTIGLVNRLREDRALVEAPGATTPEEASFWANWFQFVFLLESLNIPTGGTAMKPPSDGLMPDCAPLGREGCQVTPQDLKSKYGFVAALSGRKSSIDEIFQVFEATQRDPVKAHADLARDPAMAAALAQFLALAGAPGAAGGVVAPNPLCVLPGTPGCP